MNQVFVNNDGFDWLLQFFGDIFLTKKQIWIFFDFIAGKHGLFVFFHFYITRVFIGVFVFIFLVIIRLLFLAFLKPLAFNHAILQFSFEHSELMFWIWILPQKAISKLLSRKIMTGPFQVTQPVQWVRFFAWTSVIFDDCIHLWYFALGKK